MKHRKIIPILLLVSVLLFVVGCSSSSDAWEGIGGSYVWTESAQYTNATLALMWLDEDSVLFEFNLMEGSEAEESAMELTIPGVLSIDADGLGQYTAVAEDGTEAFSIQFALAEEGGQVEVTHTGELPISPDGSYTFVNHTMEMSDLSAHALVDFLPDAVTGLGSDILHYPDGLAGDWFYPLEAARDGGESVSARFIVAKDMSAVFRVDDGSEPVLIYGTAEPMMEAESWEADYSVADNGEMLPVGKDELIEPDEEMADAPTPVVSVGMRGGTLLCLGEQSVLEAYLPWPLPYRIEAASADSAVAALDGLTITAMGVGETEITGTLIVADGKKDFCIVVSVIESVEGRGDLIDDAEFAPVG